jgi:hypothetical protein
MKQYKTGRVLATIFLGMIFGIYKHFDQMRWLQRGRDAFLVDQNRLYDRIIQHHGSWSMLAAGLILAALAVGLYEALAAGFTYVLPPSTMEE